MPEVLMPRLSDSMEEATIVRWLKQDGEAVATGDELVEIETDKATITYEAERSGTLAIIAAEGDTVALGAPICSLSPDGAAPVSPAPATTPAPATATAGARGLKASPVARRLAAALGVDLADVTGTGPGGRVTKDDVQRASDAAPPAAVPATNGTGAAPAAGTAGVQDARGSAAIEPLNRIQRVVAQRMVEAKTTQPEFVLEVDVDMQRALDLRATVRETPGVEVVPSVNDLVVKAAALALRAHPRANGVYRDDRLELFPRVNVGIAVAAPDSLVVATIPDTDELSLTSIARTTRDLVTRARAGKLSPAELSGSTFSISNLGMFGVRRMVPILNAGQAAILGVGAVEPRPVVVDGEILVRPSMSLTLVSDHRILYGADAAQVLAAIREALEAPMSLVL